MEKGRFFVEKIFFTKSSGDGVSRTRAEHNYGLGLKEKKYLQDWLRVVWVWWGFVRRAPYQKREGKFCSLSFVDFFVLT